MYCLYIYIPRKSLPYGEKLANGSGTTLLKNLKMD